MALFKKTASQKAKKEIKKAVKADAKKAPTKQAKKEIKKAGKKAVKDIKKVIKVEKKIKRKEVGNKLVNGLKKSVGVAKDIPFAPLLPFKKIMIEALDKRNISHTNDLHDIAPKFLQNIVRNSFTSPNDQSYYENGADMVLVHNIDGKDLGTSVSKAGGTLGIVGKAATGDFVGAAGGLVSEILNYIRKLKDKKDRAKAEADAGLPITEPLTPAEQDIITQSEKVGEQLQDMAKDEAENTVAHGVKSFIFSWKGGVALIVLIIVAYKAFKK